MQDDHQQRRFGDATSLQQSIEALAKVPVDERRGFLHDRLMSHIDGICKHHGSAGKNCFNAAQIHALKDLSFLILDILDPKSKKPKGFMPALKAEFKEKTPFGQVGAIAAVVVFLVTLLGGTVTFYEKVLRPIAVAEAAAATKDAPEKKPVGLPELQITRNPMPLISPPPR